MWERVLRENSSVLSTLKQITPSDRTNVSNNYGIGDRSDIGRKPVDGQSKIFGNLDKQSRGMEGKLDTQGKEKPELFTSHNGNSKDNNPGTFTPKVYNKMYNQKIQESANSSETGVNSGKHKVNGVESGIRNKYVIGADVNNGGGCNCSKTKEKSALTESQVLGSIVALAASRSLMERA